MVSFRKLLFLEIPKRGITKSAKVLSNDQFPELYVLVVMKNSYK